MDKNELHNLPNAGFIRRLIASVYDWLLVIALMMVLSVPLVAPTNEAVAVGNPLYRLALIALTAAFFTGFWSFKGQTTGMKAWKLRLINKDGTAPGFGTALLRFAAACLSAAALGLGFVWVIIDPQKLSWHDRISGTRIVQLSKK